MAYDTAFLQHPVTGQIKEAPIGFSWTMFFFGFIPPIVRGDWKWFGIVLGLGLLAAIFTFGLGGWIPGIIGSFVWNKSYLNNLIEKGFQLKGTRSGQLERIDAVAGYTVPRVAALTN